MEQFSVFCSSRRGDGLLVILNILCTFKSFSRVIRVFLPISIQKVQSIKKPTNLCAPREILKEMCRPCVDQDYPHPDDHAKHKIN